jgi:uncharacterized protein (UPF0262 family)
MARVGVIVLAGFIDDNKFRAITDEVLSKTSSRVLSIDLILFTSKLPKDYSSETNSLISRFILMLLTIGHVRLEYFLICHASFKSMSK